MIDLSTVLSNIAKSIVDHPEGVSVTEHEEGNEILLTLSVAEVRALQENTCRRYSFRLLCLQRNSLPYLSYGYKRKP